MCARTLARGFTLVELLTVIPIIGLLLGLLLPAVHAAREEMHRTQCKNNLKQIGIAFQVHHGAYKHFPTGGWGWNWTGDPDRGFGRTQPGGWAYNILPFVEEGTVHDLGKGQPADLKAAQLAQQVSSPVKGFACPTRRSEFATFPLSQPGPINANPVYMAARMDYAANAGDRQPLPNGVETGGGPANDPVSISYFLTSDNVCEDRKSSRFANGVVYQRSMIRMKDIKDGATKTYAVGEKYLNIDLYGKGFDPADNEWMFIGYVNDTNRSANDMGNNTSNCVRDDYSTNVFNGSKYFELGRNLWGSAHTRTFNMVFCDGSVHSIPFGIDLTTHQQLANRSDGTTPRFP